MSVWESHLEQVLSIIKDNTCSVKIEKLCSELLQRDVTFNAIESALRRLRTKGYKIPLISELRNGKQYVPFTASPVDDYEVKLPQQKRGLDTLPAIVSLKKVPKKVAVVPDIHFPIHDPWAIAAMVAYLRDYKPDYVVLLGDVLDCSCLSRHPSSHRTEKLFDIKYKLTEELKAAKPFLEEMLSISNGKLTWIEGNHEIRRKNILNTNPGLQGLEALEARNLFEIPPEILWVENGQRFNIANLYFEHGDKIINSRGSANIANTMSMRRPGVSTLTGHWHTIDSKIKTTYLSDGSPQTHLTATCGHLSRVDEHSSYVSLPNWMNGFACVEFWKDYDKDMFSFHQVEMINYAFSINGKVYDGRKLM